MAVRSTMAAIIARVRLMISDPAGASQQFADQDVQDTLDLTREDLRYEDLTIAPSIVNTPLTGNQASIIFADYFSKYGWWESDVVLQAYYGGQAWVVVTPVSTELLLDQAHFQFETNVFTTGTVPGQLPPVFATGKIYDLNYAAADLLEMWASTLACAYDIVVDGQNLRRSQLMAMKLTMALHYRRQAKPRKARLNRTDVSPDMGNTPARLLDAGISTA